MTLASVELRHLGLAFPPLIFYFTVNNLNLMKRTLKNWTNLFGFLIPPVWSLARYDFLEIDRVLQLAVGDEWPCVGWHETVASVTKAQMDSTQKSEIIVLRSPLGSEGVEPWLYSDAELFIVVFINQACCSLINLHTLKLLWEKKIRKD